MSSGTPVQRRKLGVCMAKRKQKMKRLDHGGYSLVELMVVIVIMVILASVSIGVYNGYVNRARSAVFYEKGHRIAEAFKICEAEHGLSGEFDKREMAEEKRLGDYLLLDEQMVTSQVAVNLYAEAKQQKVVLVEAGVPWYLVDEELELIPSGETELALQTKNVLTQKEKQFMIELDPLTGRLDRRCRLMLRIRFESPSQCIVTIKDEGFGELFPTSNRIWEKQVEL